MLKAVVAATAAVLGALGGISSLFVLLERHINHRKLHPQRGWIAAVAAVCVVIVSGIIFFQAFRTNSGAQTGASSAQASTGVFNGQIPPTTPNDAGKTATRPSALAGYVTHRRALSSSRTASVGYAASTAGTIIQVGGGDGSVSSNVVGGDGNRVIAVPVER